MKTRNTILIFATTIFLAGSLCIHANEDQPQQPAKDPRIDKVLEQNQQILKNQGEIIQRLDKLEKDLLQIRRRSS